MKSPKQKKFYDNFIKIEKIELQDIKTLESLYSKLSSFESKVKKQNASHGDVQNEHAVSVEDFLGYKDQVEIYNNDNNLKSLSISEKDQVDMLNLEADKLEQKFEKELKERQKEGKRMENILKSHKRDVDKADKDVFKSDMKWGTIFGEVSDYENSIKKEISSFKSNAKNLGLDNVDVSKYESLLDKINSLMSNYAGR